MANSVDALVLDLLEYIALKERTYDDLLEAWHTSCPNFRYGKKQTIAD